MSQFRLRETEAAAESYLPELLSRGKSYEIWSEDKYGPWIDTGVWQVLPQTHTVEYNSISLHILVPQTLCWGAKGWTSEIRGPTGSADGLLETALCTSSLAAQYLSCSERPKPNPVFQVHHSPLPSLLHSAYVELTSMILHSVSPDKNSEVVSPPDTIWTAWRERGWNGVNECYTEPSEDVESINPLQCYGEPQVNVNAAGQRRLGCRAWSAKERVTLKHIYHSEAEKKGLSLWLKIVVYEGWF